MLRVSQVLGDDLWLLRICLVCREVTPVQHELLLVILTWTVSCIHNFMRRMTSSTYLFPAVPLGSLNKFFFQCTVFFHMHCLSPFWKNFLLPNSSELFLTLWKSYPEYHCRCYCSVTGIIIVVIVCCCPSTEV